tara:strand:- start:2855 stop:3730 length:876 start_codon:yes stop_codon:yes gene_type:complete
MTKIFVFLFLLLVSSIASAQVALIVEPASPGDTSLYPFEVKEYRFVVVNVADVPVENVQVFLSVPEELSLVVDNEDRVDRQFTIRKILPGAKEERVFNVKALDVSAQPLEIRADFGIDDLTNSSLTSLIVEPSGLAFNARLSRTSLGPGEKGSVFFDLTNNSSEKINNIKAELVSNDSVVVDSAPFELEIIDSGQTVSNTEFLFSLGSGVGRKNISLRVWFDDSEGRHLLEKSFSLDVQNRDIYVGLLVFGILFLVGISFYLRKNKPAQKVETKGIKVQNLNAAAKSSDKK